MKEYEVTATKTATVVVEGEDEDDAYANAEEMLWDLMDGPWHGTEIAELW